MKPTGYALFDLDQTLVPWDMQLLFGNWLFHHHPERRLLLLPFLLAMPFFKCLGARRMKRLFSCILNGLHAEEIEVLSQSFVDHYYPDLFYPEVVERLQAHLAQGDCVVLTSASPFFYVEKIGEKLGVHKTFGTIVEVSSDLFIPDIPINNKEEDKITALKAWLKEEGHTETLPLPHSTAYTDSTADLPLIKAAERAVLINPSERLEQEAQKLVKQTETLTPKRPFKTKKGKAYYALKLLLGLYPTT